MTKDNAELLLFSKFTNIFEKGKIASNMLKKAIAEKRGSRVQWVEVFFCLGVLQKRLLNRMFYSFLLHPSAPLGVLFQAESVGASLEAPVFSLCADRKINAKRRDFVGFLRGCIGQSVRAAPSAARTNLDFRC